MTGRMWRPRMRLSGIGDPPPDFDMSRIYEGTTNPYAGIGDFTYGSGPERNFGLPGTSTPPTTTPPTTTTETNPNEYGNQPNQGGGTDQGAGESRSDGTQGYRDMSNDDLVAYGKERDKDLIAGYVGPAIFGQTSPVPGFGLAMRAYDDAAYAEEIAARGLGMPGVPGLGLSGSTQSMVSPELQGRSDPSQHGGGIGGFGWDGSDAGMEGAANEQAGMDARSGDGDGPDIAVANGGGIGEVSGDGDGRDDKIPALLSDGEHVIPADVVSAMGRGSTKAGHKKLNAMILKEREKNRKTLGKLPPPKG